MKSKKAQITVFIILGIVLLAVAGFAFYAAGFLRQSTLEKEAERILSDIQRKSALDYYITSCLQRSLENGLVLLGEQGGAIYQSQANQTKFYNYWRLTGIDPALQLLNLRGIPVLPFNNSNTTQNVSYGIYANYEMMALRSYSVYLGGNNPPSYPYPKNLTSVRNDMPLSNRRFQFNELCMPDGPNTANLASRLNIDFSSANNTCSDHYGSNSFQYYLKKFVEEDTKKCVNISMLASFLGYSVVEGNINASVLFTDEGVGVLIDYPLLISVNSNIPFTKRLEYTTYVPVRIKKIYESIWNLLWEEKNNIFFDLRNAQNGNPVCRLPGNVIVNCIYENMSLNFIENVCQNSTTDGAPSCSEKHHNYSNILQLTDYNSSISGKPYVFQVAIENRPPALSWIHQTPANNEYDIIVRENETIFINPYGFDPDEDLYVTKTVNSKRYMDTIYLYSGWKETWDEEFNFSCCSNINLVGSPTFDCTKEEGRSRCTVRTIIDLKNWTDYRPYNETSRNASFRNVTRNDTGSHVVRVQVCDEEGLCDWQDVRILVLDFPQVIINNSNEYDDINDSVASIEDPYTLDGSKSVVATSTITGLVWSDILEGKIWNDYPDDILLNLPDSSVSIKDILQYSFKIPGNHEISLSIHSDAGTTTDSITVPVFECLPHRSPEEIYPYGPEYSGNHTCCKGNPLVSHTVGGWGTFKDETQVCYYDEVLACHPAVFSFSVLPNAVSENPSGILSSSPSFTDDAPTDNPRKNDIYKREVEQKCSGNRGNACSGAIIYTYTNSKLCYSANPALGETESCQGPAQNKNNCDSLTSSKCYNFTNGNSFEKEFLLPDLNGITLATGICNKNPECSTPGASGYDDGTGLYLCNATCDGNGGCTYATECALNPSPSCP